MKKVALVMRHSIREDINADGSGGMLTEQGRIAAQAVGANIKIPSNIQVTYYGTWVQRTIDTCKNIEYGRTGNYNVTVNHSPVVNGKEILNGGYFQIGNGNIENGWPGLTDYALGLKKYDFMLEPKKGSEDWLKAMLSVMPNGLSIWVSHDFQMVPLLYNLTRMTVSEANEIKQKNGFRQNPWTSPLSGIAIINNDGNISVKRIKGLKNGFISSDDYGHDFTQDML